MHESVTSAGVEPMNINSAELIGSTPTFREECREVACNAMQSLTAELSSPSKMK